jgi:hypothetical protein
MPILGVEKRHIIEGMNSPPSNIKKLESLTKEATLVEEPQVNHFISNPINDLALIIMSPVLVVAAFYIADLFGALLAFSFVAHTLGSAGHHLPGMLRAYGDKQLNRQYLARLIFAPIALMSVSMYFAFSNFQALTVVLLTWGVWHGMAQCYGFARIYDSKLMRSSPLNARFDLILYCSWFATGLFLSQGRMSELLGVLYESGLPTIDPVQVATFQQFWLIVTGLVTAIYIARETYNSVKGIPPNWIKHVATIFGCGFWCYSMISIEIGIVALAMFELFHDIQYLAIVWFFNRKRVDQGVKVGKFTRFVFRARPSMLFLYLGIIGCYGAFAFLQYEVSQLVLQKVIIGFFIFSTLLHFYLDGFIWKLRKKSISNGLELDTSELAQSDARKMHVNKWLYAAAAVGGLMWLQNSGVANKLDRIENLAKVSPYSAAVQYDYAKALEHSGSFSLAKTSLTRAIEIRPDFMEAHFLMGQVLEKQNLPNEASEFYKRVLEIDKSNIDANMAMVRIKALTEYGVPLQFVDP